MWEKGREMWEREGERLNENERKISGKPNTLFLEFSIDTASGPHIIKQNQFICHIIVR